MDDIFYPFNNFNLEWTMPQTNTSETDQDSFEEYEVLPKIFSRKKVWHFITKASRKLNLSSKSSFSFEKQRKSFNYSSTFLDAKESLLRDYFCQYLTPEYQSPYCVNPAYNNLVQPIPSFGQYIKMSRPRSPNQNQTCSSTCKNQWYNRTPASCSPRWYRTCIPSIVPRNHLMPPIARRCVDCPWRDDEDEQEICGLCRALIIDQKHTCCKCSKDKNLSDSDSDEEDVQTGQDNEHKNKKSKHSKYEDTSCECNLDVSKQKVSTASFGTQTLPYPKERQQRDFHDYLEKYPFNNTELPDGRLNINNNKQNNSTQNEKVTQDNDAVLSSSQEMLNRIKWKIASLHSPPFPGGHTAETDMSYTPWKRISTEDNKGISLADCEKMSTTLLDIQKSLNRIEKRQIDEPVPGNYFEQTPTDKDRVFINGNGNIQKASHTNVGTDGKRRKSSTKINTIKERGKINVRQSVGFDESSESSKNITKRDTASTDKWVNTQKPAPDSLSLTNFKSSSSTEQDKASVGVNCDEDEYTTKAVVTLDNFVVNGFKINATTQTSVELYSDAVCGICRRRFEIDIHFRNTGETSKGEDVGTEKRKRGVNSKSKNKGKSNARRNAT